MRRHITTRLIDGEVGDWIDVGCDNFDRAAHNRKMVKLKQHVQFWIAVENALAGTPLNRRLPDWVPQDDLLRGVLVDEETIYAS